MIVVGITGTLGAGKDTVVNYLVQKKGFQHLSVTAFLTQEIKKRDMPINRDSMFVVANELRKNFGASFIVEQLYEQARKNDKNTIIESIRAVGEVETLKGKENFIFFAIDADQKTRYQRIVLRSGEKDKVSYDEFLLNEQREMTNTDPSKQNLSACMEMADYTFTNNGTLEDLYQQIEIVINEFRI